MFAGLTRRRSERIKGILMSGSRSGGRVTLMAIAVIVMSGWITPAYATHSVPQPYLWYWDLGNDGDADGNPAVDAAGGGWTTLALARLQGAITEWETDTSFNPHYVASGNFQVYRDGTPPCGPGGFFDPGDVMVTCYDADLKPVPNAPPGEYYWDIFTADTYAQTDAGLSGLFDRFWYGSGQSPYSGDADFQGIMTHELGHWVLLDDEYGSNCNFGTGVYTMCGEPGPSPELQTYRMRTLTSDDIAAANVPY